MEQYIAYVAIRKHHFYKSFVSIYYADVYRCECTEIEDATFATLDHFYDLVQNRFTVLFKQYLTQFKVLNSIIAVESFVNQKKKKLKHKTFDTFDHIFLNRFSDSYIVFKAKMEPENVPLTIEILNEADTHINEYIDFVSSNLFDQLEAELKTKKRLCENWYHFTDQLYKSSTYFNFANQKVTNELYLLTKIPSHLELELIETDNLFDDLTQILIKEYISIDGLDEYQIIVDMSMHFIINFLKYEKTPCQHNTISNEVQLISSLFRPFEVLKNTNYSLNGKNLDIIMKTWVFMEYEIVHLIRTIGISEEKKLICKKAYVTLDWLCSVFLKLIWEKNHEFACTNPSLNQDIMKDVSNIFLDDYVKSLQLVEFESLTSKPTEIMLIVEEIINDLSFFYDVTSNKYKIALLCELIFGLNKRKLFNYIYDTFSKEKNNDKNIQHKICETYMNSVTETKRKSNADFTMHCKNVNPDD